MRTRITPNTDTFYAVYLIFGTFLFQIRHTKFYNENTLHNLKMYTQANKYKDMYLTSAKTKNLSTNFVFKSTGTESKI